MLMASKQSISLVTHNNHGLMQYCQLQCDFSPIISSVN